mgnify:FL=1
MRHLLASVLAVAALALFSGAIAVEPTPLGAGTSADRRAVPQRVETPEAPEAVSGPPTQVAAGFFPPSLDPKSLRVLTEKDLEPVAWREPFGRVKTLLEAGQGARALGLLRGVEPGSVPERYLYALALNAGGSYPEAAAALVRLAAEYPALSDHCYFLAASAFEEAKDYSAAAGAFDAVEEGSSLHEDAVEGLARSLLENGDVAGALASLQPLASRPAPAWGRDRPGEALFSVAELLERLGRKEEAAAVYLGVWSEHPRCRASGRALQRARSLGAEPSADQLVARAELVMEAHRNQEAVALVRPLVEAPPKGLSSAGLCRARYVLGKSFRKLRRHSEALAVLRAVERDCEADETWARALYVAGTSASLVDRAAGIAFYRQLAEKAPAHSFADDALFFAADLLAREGKTDEARRVLKRLARLYPDGDFRAEGLFQLFWLDRAERRHEEGLEALERLERDYAFAADPSIVERARYWRGRTLVDLGRQPEGLGAYESLALAHPASFYSLLARSRIKELAPERAEALAERLAADPDQAPPLALPVARLEGDRRLAAAVELLRLGFEDQAADELLEIDRSALRGETPPHDLRLLVALLSRAGKVRTAHVVARTELKRDLSGDFAPERLHLWRAAFPLAFRGLVETRAAEAKVDPDLLQALIREESAFDPRAGSWAGAMGLCQLMMPTAREVAGWLKVGGPMTRERLHDPDLNIRLGSVYLARLLKQWNGNLALAVASYNAGAGNVGKWLRAAGQRDLDEFIEEIPIQETRNYVKRVLGSYSAYQLLHGRSAAAPTLGQALAAR